MIDDDYKTDAHDTRERERFAKAEMCRDLKDHYERQGKQKTGEQIEREVQAIQEDVYKRKDHPIYKR